MAPETTADPPRTARQIARAEMTRSITDAARAQLAEVGASGLSLRAVARDLGVASSALYRYFASRDDLLTALIIDAYDAIGGVAEAAAADAATQGAPGGRRWLAVCRAVRAWAVEHPNEWALVYGSPVPGYAAPEDTIAPASRIGRVLAEVVTDAVTAGEVAAPAHPLPEPRLVAPGVVDQIGGLPDAPHDDVVERSLVLWIALVGTVSFELFGHLTNVVTDYGAYFDRAMAVAAEGVGLDIELGDR